MSYQFKGRGLFRLTGRNMNNTIGAFNSHQAAVPQLTPVKTLASGTSGVSVIAGGGLTASQLNTINLSNITSVAGSGYSTDWLVGSGINNPQVKKYEVYESTEDLIACSVAAHRLMKEKQLFYKLLDNELFSRITPDDRSKSQTIKDYYSKKVMMRKLKGNGQLSRFREDMNKLIHSDCLTFKENMIGIAYWLPEFYEYDTNLDEIKTHVDTNQNFEQMNKDRKPNSMQLTVELETIKKIQRKTKRSKGTEYWFRDSKVNAAVVLTVEEKNQLQHLWDYMYDTEKVLKIEGRYYRKTLDNFEYFSIQNWKIART